MTPDVPPALRDFVKRDLRPTRPLMSPFVRALVLTPLAFAIVLGVPQMHFFRSDMAAIGFLKAWGFSFGQALAGLVIVAAALRESIPGRSLSRAAIAGTIAAGLAVPSALFVLTASTFDTGPAPGAALQEGAVCFRVSALSAVPALIGAAFLVWRALAMRPAVAGALYGLGCGLVADAGLRLYCEYTVPQHVLVAHGGAILGAMLLGGCVAVIIARRQA